MAKLEIPSIVVDKGSQPGGSVSAPHKMESQRSLRSQRTLSKQEEIDEEEHLDMGSRIDSSPMINGPDEHQLPNRPTNLNILHRSRSHSKVKLLVRSHAMREESPEGGPGGSDCEGEGNRVGRHRLRREGSSTDQTSWSEPALSRGNSREQYDGSNNPIDLHQFIVDTLNRNYKDRMLLFKIENELISLSKDTKRNSHKFNQMSSYQRMLVHRVAQYFGMEHNVDTTGMSVIVNTTKNTRIPDRRFRDFVREDLLEEPRRSILKRDSSSFEETGSYKNGDKMFNGDSRRSKSFEEREEEYEKVRRRIFNHAHFTDGDLECMEEYHHGWDNDGSSGCPRCSHHSDRSVRLLKVESYESGDTLKANSLRLSVSKSHSFNGYDQNSAQQQPRVLTKQGSSMSSRISPSQSSGYKSQRSDATLSATPSPTATPSLHTQLSGQSGGAMSPEPDTPVVWAVTDMASVPPGSMLIHPQSGQPYTNADGSIYHYDPSNPPTCLNESNQIQPVPQQSSPQPTQPQILSPKQVIEDSGVVNEKSDRLPRYDSIPSGYTPIGVQSSVQPSVQTGVQSYSVGSYPPPQHQLPLVVPPHPPDQYHLYQAPSHHCPTSPPSTDPRLPPPDTGAIINNDLSACMMGMALDGRTDRQPIMYWQPHHIQGGVPMYYSSNQVGSVSLSSNGTGRYHNTGSVPSVQAVQPAFSPISIPHPPPPTLEHTVGGSCYGSGYMSGTSPTGPASPECIPTYPSTIHMYYPACTSGGSVGSGVVSNSSYYGSPTCTSLVSTATIPYQPQSPCTHPTSPQNVCGQLAVYNGCYPAGSHYSANSPSIPGVPQIFRKPSLQVGVGCSSPLRTGGYPMSPTMKERSLSIDDSKPTHTSIQPGLPPTTLYGIRVLPAGDMRLFNTTRLPFVPSKPINRKHKFKMSGGGMRNLSSESMGSTSSSHYSHPGNTTQYVPTTNNDITKA